MNLDWDSSQLSTLTSDWSHGKVLLLLLLLLLLIIIIVIIMQSSLISGSQKLQGLEFTCSCIHAGRRSLSLQQYVLYVSMWNSYVRRCVPAAEQTFAPDYWHVLLNVMLEHRCSIQAWLERAEAPPSGWRTHAIPHICSISDCNTEAPFTLSDIRKEYCYHGNQGFIVGIIIGYWNPCFYPSKAPL